MLLRPILEGTRLLGPFLASILIFLGGKAGMAAQAMVPLCAVFINMVLGQRKSDGILVVFDFANAILFSAWFSLRCGKLSPVC